MPAAYYEPTYYDNGWYDGDVWYWYGPQTIVATMNFVRITIDAFTSDGPTNIAINCRNWTFFGIATSPAS